MLFSCIYTSMYMHAHIGHVYIYTHIMLRIPKHVHACLHAYELQCACMSDIYMYTSTSIQKRIFHRYLHGCIEMCTCIGHPEAHTRLLQALNLRSYGSLVHLTHIPPACIFKGMFCILERRSAVDLGRHGSLHAATYAKKVKTFEKPRQTQHAHVEFSMLSVICIVPHRTSIFTCTVPIDMPANACMCICIYT